MMDMQLSHMIQDCPVCGRPVEVQTGFVGREVTCGHCRGQFVLYESQDGKLATAACGRSGVLQRSERLLRRGCKASIASANHAAPDCKHATATEPFTSLVVEHRDEVFARIATDMAEEGMRVVRAESAVEALKLYGLYRPILVVSNLDLPDRSGWLLAGNLRFVDPKIRIWLYQPRSSRCDGDMARHLQVDALIDYAGDLLDLSETIVSLLVNRCESMRATRDARKASETTENASWNSVS